MLGTQIPYNDAKYIKNQLPDLNIQNLCAKTSLAYLKAVFEQSDPLISVDTETIHVATTTNAILIGLYEPSTPENSRPVSSKAIILYTEEDCSPCHYKRTVLGMPCSLGDKIRCLIVMELAKNYYCKAEKSMKSANMSFI